MKPCDAGKDGVISRRQVAPNLSEQQLRELLATLMKTPTDVVLQVGHVLRLVLAVMVAGLPAGDGIDGSESRCDSASGSETSRRAIRAAGSSRAAVALRRAGLTTIEEKERARSTVAAAMEIVRREGPVGGENGGGSGAAKGSGEGEKVLKSTRYLRSWAAKAKRNVPSLLELLDSGVSTMGIDHARLVMSHAEAIPVEKAERALSVAGSTLRFMVSAAVSVIHRHSSGAREPCSADGASDEETGSKASVLIAVTRAENQEVMKEKISAVKLQALARGVLKRTKRSRAVATAVEVQALWRGASVRARLSKEAKTRAETAAMEESSAVTLQALARGVLKRSGLSRAVAAAAVAQARWRGALVRAQLVKAAKTRAEMAAMEESSAVTLQALARGVLKRAGLSRGVAAAAVVQAHWRGALVRARLVTEVKTRAENQGARKESSVVKLQALARGVLKRMELWRAVAAAAVAQGAWRRRQARLHGDRSNAVERAAVMVQAWYRSVAARAEGQDVREGNWGKEEEPSMEEHMQAARNELLQHAQLLPSVLQSDWWTTAEGKQMYRKLGETYRQLADCMVEGNGRFMASFADVGTAQTSPSSSLREQMAENEEEAGEMLVLEFTGPTTYVGNGTGYGTDTGTPPLSGGSSPAVDHTTPTAAGASPSPPRRRRRSSTGSRGRSPPRSAPTARPAPPDRWASPPRPTETRSGSLSKLSPPASPGRVGTAGCDHNHHLHHHQHCSEICPQPCVGDLGEASSSVVPSPADFAAGVSGDTPRQREGHEHHPPPVEPDGSRTIETCLTAEPEWYPLCQSGYGSFTDAQVEWALRMIAEVSGQIGATTEILALAAMTLGAAFGNSTLLETSLRDADLFVVPAACVLDALIRNADVFEFTVEAAIDTMVSVTVAAKGNGGYDNANSSEAVANDTKARLIELRGMVKLATPDGCDWAGPMELVIELVRRSGTRPIERSRRIIDQAGVFVRSAVLDGALREFAPSQLACSAYYSATGTLGTFDADEAAGSNDYDGEDHRGFTGDDLEEREPVGWN
eukprot:g6652.t1